MMTIMMMMMMIMMTMMTMIMKTTTMVTKHRKLVSENAAEKRHEWKQTAAHKTP